ncbi:MAG: globin domain-containing protein [Gammaproteobacteria bacterium]|nr:globin domain-containing protein [Gammaproteobacteria bacterium]
MKIAPENISTIKNCWKKITSGQQETAFVEAFYSHLFKLNPGYRDLFPGDMDVMSSKLRETLNQVINGLEHFTHLEASLKELGQSHQALKITPDMYAHVTSCILLALDTILGAALRDHEKQSWKEAFDLISGTMISGYN